MRINPNALVFWGVCCCAGYLLNGVTGLIVGLLAGLSISLLAGMRG